MSIAQAQAPTAQQAAEFVMQVSTGYMPAVALHAAAKLSIADLLADGAKPVAELARTTGVHEQALYRTLRALASLGIFAETSPRTFSNTPFSEGLRKDAGPLRDMVLWIANALHMRCYAEFLHSVNTGETVCDRVLGAPIFDYFASHMDEGAVFNQAMTSWTALNTPAYLEAYDFSGISTLVDVAGGHGFLLSSVLAAYPQMRGVLFDLPHVLDGARRKIAEAGVAERCELVAGDFFESVPGGDAIMMKHIIHDWDDAKATVILDNCFRALKPGAKLIIFDTVIQPGNEPDFAKWMDLEMLVLPGGRERTEQEFRELLDKSGFRLTRVVPTKGVLAIIEADREE